MQKRTFLTDTAVTSIDAPVPIVGLIVINSTDQDCICYADNGDSFPAPALVISTWSLPPTSRIRAQLQGTPTNGKACNVIVTDEATLNSTSQLQTLAGAASGAGDMKLLWDSNDSGLVLPTGTIVTPNLAQTYKHLRVEMTNVLSGPNAEIAVQLNGDNTASYYTNVLQAVNGVVGQQNRIGATSAYLGNGGGLSGAIVFDIPNYARQQGGGGKIISSSGYFLTSLAANQQAVTEIRTLWQKNTAVQNLVFSVGGGLQFTAGTLISIYGLS